MQKRTRNSLNSFSQHTMSSFSVMISLFFFLLICLKYALLLNLWGDEAASFLQATLPIEKIIRTDDVHAPTYYFLLKLFICSIDSSFRSEMIFRLIHALIFTGGLYFGCKTIQLLFKSNWLISSTLLFVVLLPTSLFYATNIRMYALLYCLSMWYIYTVMKYLGQDTPTSITQNGDILIAGICLIGLDYVGLIYFGLGSLFLLIKAGKRIDKQIGTFISVPPILITIIYLIPTHFSVINHILAWPATSSMSISIRDNTAATLAKLIFNSARPFIELTNISYKIISVPIAYLCFYSIFLIFGTLLFIKKFLSSKDIRLLFILALAYLWGVTFFMGVSLTRLFLPSQFFMSALILFGLFELKCKTQFRLIAYIVLIAFNLYTAIFPLLRFDSLIPYRQIAINLLTLAHKNNIDQIYIAYNSENYESITRYILQQNDSRVTFHPLDVKFTQQDLPKQPFLFLSYMNENGRFVDAKRLTTDFDRKVSILRTYVKLDELPYNSLWTKHLLSQSKQSYVYVLYLVK